MSLFCVGGRWRVADEVLPRREGGGGGGEIRFLRPWMLRFVFGGGFANDGVFCSMGSGFWGGVGIGLVFELGVRGLCGGFFVLDG